MKKTFILFGLLVTLACGCFGETFRSKDPHVRYSTEVEGNVYVSYKNETDLIQHLNYLLKVEDNYSISVFFTEDAEYLLEVFDESFLSIFEEENVSMVSFVTYSKDGKRSDWLIAKNSLEEYNVVICDVAE